MNRIFAVALLLALGVTAACRKDGHEGAAAVEHPMAIGASIAMVSRGSFTETVDAVGVVTVRPGRVAALSAPAATRVSRVFVSAGANVRAGQILVEFEQLPFQAAATSAEAALSAAESALTRAQRLVAAGVLPRRDAEVAAADAAQARLLAITARRASELSRLRSPIGGTVIRMTAELGAGVDQGQTLVEVADPTALDALLNVAPAEAARVRVGQPVSLYMGAGADVTGQPIATALVADVGAMVDSASRGIVVRLRVLAGAGALRLGATLFARVRVAEHANALMVPLEALVPTGEGFQLFVVDSGGMAHVRAVTVGGRSDVSAWITNGLAAKERVVTRGAFGMDDSVRVEMVKP